MNMKMKVLAIATALVLIAGCAEEGYTYTATVDVVVAESKYKAMYEVTCHANPVFPSIQDTYGELKDLSELLTVNEMQSVMRAITNAAYKTCKGE